MFGPHPRDFSFSMPEKIKAAALKSSLNAKLKENNIIVLEGFKLEKAKTKEAVKVFSNLKIKDNGKSKSVLLLIHKMDDDLKRALGNIGFLNFNLAQSTHTYEVLSHKKLVITKEGLSDLTSRLKK